MTTNHIVSLLLRLARDLDYVYERSRSVRINEEDTSIPVKGPNFLLAVIKRQIKLMEILGKKFPELKDIKKSMEIWIKRLDKNYKEQNDEKSTRQLKLKFIDAFELQEESSKWLSAVIRAYEKPVTAILDQQKLYSIIPTSHYRKLDAIGKNDLHEGISVLQHGFPTSSSMILFRVGEKLIQKYYKKIIKKPPKNLTWGQMISELKQIKNYNETILGYLTYLNKKRIDTVHPYRRYSQEECEKVLIHIKNLLDEF